MAPTDRRQCLLSLTAKGRMAFAPLDQRSQNEIAAMIGKLSVADQDRIVGAMRTIESVLGETPANRIVGRSTASQIASASAASCLLRLMYAFTYCAGISRTSCPSTPSSRAQ